MNSLVKKTLILIITSLVIRALSLVNRVVLTRLLGNVGISLYVISLPSIMLFVSIASFSLNTTLSKIIAENMVTKKYSNKTIIKKAIIIGMITTAITSLLLFLSIKPLVYSGLKQKDAFYPILSCIIFLPLVTLNSIYRGYFNGINKIDISAYANLIEQVSRIITATIFLYVFLPYGVIVSVTMSILAMAVGEVISLIYILIKIKKLELENSESIDDPSKIIFSTALPITTSRLIGNLTEFLEPIIYTTALVLIGYSTTDILFKYSEVTAYAIPLITLCSFVSQSIAVAIIPNISYANAENNYNKVNYYIKKALLYSFIPGILVTLLLMNYGKEYMLFIYDTEIGSNYVSNLSLFFIIYYLTSPLYAIMQALGKAKFLFRFNLITDIFKLALIFTLTFIPWISYYSLIIALLVNVIIATLTLYFYLKNNYKFKFGKRLVYKSFLLIIFTFLALKISQNIFNSFIIETIVTSVSFILFLKLLKITSLNYE